MKAILSRLSARRMTTGAGAQDDDRGTPRMITTGARQELAYGRIRLGIPPRGFATTGCVLGPLGERGGAAPIGVWPSGLWPTGP